MPSPQTIQWAKVRIAMVIISALSVLSVLVYLLSGGTWLKSKAYLVTYIPDSTGLDTESPVELNGVDVGKVESLGLTRSKDPNRVVRARLVIQAVFLPRIPEDSVTEIDSLTLLGDKYIDISMGKSPRSVEPGGELHFRQPSSLVTNIDLVQFSAQLRSIDQIISDIQAGKGSLGAFFVNDDMYRDVLGDVVTVEKGLHAAVNAQSSLGRFLHSADMHNDVVRYLRELDDSFARLQANPLMRDSSQYNQIRDQIVSLRHTLADLSAGQFFASDAAYREWNHKVTAWIESVDALNSGQGSFGRMLSSAQTYDSLNGRLRDLATFVKEFRENPQKFLRIKLF
jgi:phospholipid/cholesterol/gamma-HCH transport system substrate-binding protein